MTRRDGNGDAMATGLLWLGGLLLVAALFLPRDTPVKLVVQGMGLCLLLASVVVRRRRSRKSSTGPGPDVA